MVFFDSLWSPAVDIVQEGDHFLVKADLPGMKKDEIEITLKGDTLTISGEKKKESEQKDDSAYRSERYYGKFSRSLVLPSTVDSNKIEAVLQGRGPEPHDPEVGGSPAEADQDPVVNRRGGAGRRPQTWRS